MICSEETSILHHYKIDLAHFESGIYLLKVKTKNYSETEN